MDRTIRPKFPKTELPKPKLPIEKKLVLKRPADQPSIRETQINVDLPPSLYLVTGNFCKDFPLSPDDYQYTIGRSKDATITIDDNNLSPIHLTILKIKDECLFMDRGKRDLLAFDGIDTRQAFTPVESRLIVKLGTHWLIYEASNVVSTDTVSINQNFNDIEPLPKDDIQGRVIVGYDGKQWHSTRNCCLIGTHPICDITLKGDSAAAFTCMIYWTAEGIFVEKIGTCRAAVCVDGSRISSRKKLEGGELLTIGKESLPITFEGEVNERAQKIYRHVKPRPEMALTILSGAEPKTYPLPTNTQHIIGRLSTAGIHLDSPSVSRQHSKVMVRDKFFSIQDNGSFNKTIVNREEVDKATVFAGDIIELGDCALLAHYNVVRF